MHLRKWCSADALGDLSSQIYYLRIDAGMQHGLDANSRELVDAFRTDGFTSLAVVAGVIGIWLGFPLADPIVGLVISSAIVVLLLGTSRDIGRRLLDGVDPAWSRRPSERSHRSPASSPSTTCGCAGPGTC